MSNAFVKMMSHNVANKYNNHIISDIQSDLHIQTKNLGQKLYKDIVNNLNNNVDNVDINTVLKCYLLEQILTQKDSLQSSKDYKSTPNPDIKFNVEDNRYYIIKDNREIAYNNIVKVNDNGSYIVIEQIRKSSFKIKRMYNKEHELSEIQILLGNGKCEINQFHAAELLGLKKLYSQKYKYSGFSGNSSDFLAAIKNKFYSPIDTSTFIDRYCNCYKWSFRNKAFIRCSGSDTESPLLVDYEFLTNGKVIKKEYTGLK